MKSMIVIGAGIAGLSTGCYARMNGYDATIFEMHHKPGGLCTAWERQGFIIDGCIHHLAGAGASSLLHRTWQELGAFGPEDIKFFDELTRVEDLHGGSFTVYTDIQKLESQMKQYWPKDAAVIEEYARAAQLFTRVDLLGLAVLGPLKSAIRLLPLSSALHTWGRVNLKQFSERFTHPFLRRAFPSVQYNLPDIPMLIHLSFLAGCHRRILGWPKGGALAFSHAIEKRYLNLGGNIGYRSKVKKILVDNDKAVGVRLEDDTEHRADIVVSCADGHTTIFDMLDARYIDDQLRSYYEAAPDYLEMSVHVSFGTSRDMSGEPHSLVLLLDDPIRVMDQAFDRLSIEVFNFDSSLAPPGKWVVKVMLGSSYEYWNSLRRQENLYNAKKNEVADRVLEVLDTRFPGLAASVEMSDVATPLTTERYTGNWRAAQAWSPPDRGPGMKALSRTLPGLDNLYMAGQWAEGMIGISTAAISGRTTVQSICRKHRKKFVTDLA